LALAFASAAGGRVVAEEANPAVWNNEKIKEITPKNLPQPGDEIDIHSFETIHMMEKTAGVYIPKKISIPHVVQGKITHSEADQDPKSKVIKAAIDVDQTEDGKAEVRTMIVIQPDGVVDISNVPLNEK